VEQIILAVVDVNNNVAGEEWLTFVRLHTPL